MAKRHALALLIAEGAAHPRAIARAIIEACDEVQAERGHPGTADMYDDAAIRLMAHELCAICNTRAIDIEPMLYNALLAECRAKM